MSYGTLSISNEGEYIRHLRIDVPGDPLNLVTPALHDDLLDAVRELRQDATARAIVITAEGRAFSGGGHMTELFSQFKDIDTAMRSHQRAREITSQLLDLPAPVVCAVQGTATGLGASIALFSDFLIFAQGGQLLDPHVRAGLVAGDGGTLVFPFAMSMQQAKRHLLLCQPLKADEALRLGIAMDVVELDQLVDRRDADRKRVGCIAASCGETHQAGSQCPLANSRSLRGRAGRRVGARDVSDAGSSRGDRIILGKARSRVRGSMNCPAVECPPLNVQETT